MTAPKYSERPIDPRTGLFSPSWYRFLAARSEGTNTDTKQDASPVLDEFVSLTGRGFFARTSTGRLVMRKLIATDGVQVTDGDANNGNPTISTDWGPHMARLSLGV